MIKICQLYIKNDIGLAISSQKDIVEPSTGGAMVAGIKNGTIITVCNLNMVDFYSYTIKEYTDVILDSILMLQIN